MKTKLLLMIVFAAIVAVCGITAMCFAQKKAKTGITPVLEKSFKDTLENVIWVDTVLTVSTARKLGVKELEGKINTDQVKVMYPKVVFVTRNNKPYHSSYNNTTAIRFVDINGKIIKELLPIKKKLEFNNINISKNKMYLCITTWTERNFLTTIEGREVNAPLYETAIYNNNGRLLRVIKQVNPGVDISPDGEYVVGFDAEWGNGPVGVYNERGLLREIKKDEMGWDIDFASDGSWFAITVEVNDKDTSFFDRPVSSAKLLVIDKNGKDLWQKERIAWGSAAASCPVRITNDSLITVITGVDDYTIYSFDRNGTLLGKKQGTVDQLRGFEK